MLLRPECAECHQRRLDIASCRNVRDRFVTYLFQCRVNGDTFVELPYSQTELADYLNVSRPALSSEIKKMEKEGLIKVSRRHILLLQGLNPETYYRACGLNML